MDDNKMKNNKREIIVNQINCGKIMIFPITKSVLLMRRKLVALTDKPIKPAGEPLASDYEILERDELHHRLKTYILELLEFNFDRLTQLMYRHDVAENKFHAALDSGNLEEQASKLADAVIERELEKIETRKAYRNNQAGSSPDLIDE
jgi:hypothetical protein